MNKRVQLGPNDGDCIVFSVIPNGSYASVAVPYNVKRTGSTVYLRRTDDTSGTWDHDYTYAWAKWDVVV
jgi:hypothetical protein